MARNHLALESANRRCGPPCHFGDCFRVTLALNRTRVLAKVELGMEVLLAFAAIIMPWLAAQKRRLSMATASAALRADAAESAVCGYLALIALAGLAANAVRKVRWADPAAALALLPLIVREGWETMKGKPYGRHMRRRISQFPCCSGTQGRRVLKASRRACLGVYDANFAACF